MAKVFFRPYVHSFFLWQCKPDVRWKYKKRYFYYQMKQTKYDLFSLILFLVSFHNIVLFTVIVGALDICSCASYIMAVEDFNNET